MAVALNVVGGTHKATNGTTDLLEEIGGYDALLGLTRTFYGKMFQDSHLDQFVRSHDDPHPERLALWIAQKMTVGGRQWDEEREERDLETVVVGRGERTVVHDRSSAHSAAWRSPKRDLSLHGRRFKLHDCRLWMRLMFWSARERGLFPSPGGAAPDVVLVGEEAEAEGGGAVVVGEEARRCFQEWFVRFIGHFIGIYESTAPQFARESARWSEDPANIERYLADGRCMTDVLADGYRLATAQQRLPPDERSDYTWPYSF